MEGSPSSSILSLVVQSDIHKMLRKHHVMTLAKIVTGADDVMQTHVPPTKPRHARIESNPTLSSHESVR